MEKKCFLAAQVMSPWRDLPQRGRVIDPNMRHLTLLFLGLVSSIPKLILPTFKIGPSGVFSSLAFLPEKTPRVIAYEVDLLSQKNELLNFQKEIEEKLGSKPSKGPFFPHVSLCRENCINKPLWENWFTPLPFFINAIHLYESLPNLQYVPIESISLLPPFEVREHTADIAFLIRGKNMQDLYIHAAIALSFSYPHITSFLETTLHSNPASFEEVVIALNEIITKIDTQIGSPLKAVSFQGDLILNPESDLYEWEMIVDV